MFFFAVFYLASKSFVHKSKRETEKWNQIKIFSLPFVEFLLRNFLNIILLNYEFVKILNNWQFYNTKVTCFEGNLIIIQLSH